MKAKKIDGITYNTRMTVNFAKYLVKYLNSKDTILSVAEIHRLVVKTEC
jgi:hypothetical protein